MERELEKLEINLGGVSIMTRLPDAVFVADPKREAIATKEVNKLGLPLIGLVDTNCDPDEVDYLIPGNDDAIRSCSLIVKTLARAVEEGRQQGDTCAELHAAPSVGAAPIVVARRAGRRRPSPRAAAAPKPAPSPESRPAATERRPADAPTAEADARGGRARLPQSAGRRPAEAAAATE